MTPSITTPAIPLVVLQAWAWEEADQMHSGVERKPVVALIAKLDDRGYPQVEAVFVDEAWGLRIVDDILRSDNSEERVFYADDPDLDNHAEELRQEAIDRARRLKGEA